MKIEKSDANEEPTLDELCRHWLLSTAPAPTGQQPMWFYKDGDALLKALAPST